MMVTATLNIGLSSYVGSKYSEDLEAMLVTLRKGVVFNWLVKLGVDFYVEDRAHPVLDAGHEPTLVVVLFNLKPTSMPDAKIADLCELIGQHCIAAKFRSGWVNPLTEFCRLIGPGKSLYEPFDEMKFLNPLRRID